jgi:hypothetical protein
MRANRLLILAALGPVIFLAGCGSSQQAKPEVKPESDPALTGALGDQIMVDPELANQNKPAGAISAANPSAVEVPLEARGPDEAAAAKAEAVKLAGGRIETAPGGGNIAALTKQAATAAQVAAGAPGGGACADKVEYSANWVNVLPAPLAVYPRGAVQEAAGTDAAGCKLRVVNFTSPVAPKDIVDYYYTRARQAGYASRHAVDGQDHVLGGDKGAAAYVVYARKLDNGMTEVDLVASGA